MTYSHDRDWERVTIDQKSASERGGVLTMVSTLTKSSYPRRTSPVLRGRWILEDVLGSRVPPPPPNVPALDETDHTDKPLTLREKLELHRQKPECASCHDRMDPLGFGLENYDAIGRWRSEEEDSHSIRGDFTFGETFQGPQELKQLILKRKDEFQKHFVRKLTGFAMGRELNKFDQCIIDRSIQRLNEEQKLRLYSKRYYSRTHSSIGTFTNGNWLGTQIMSLFRQSKTSPGRRRFLRGCSVALALPWLESLATKRASASAMSTAVRPPVRTGFIYFPNGVWEKAWVPPSTEKTTS